MHLWHGLKRDLNSKKRFNSYQKILDIDDHYIFHPQIYNDIIQKYHTNREVTMDSSFKKATLLITGGTESFRHTVLKYFLTTDIG